MEQQFAVLTDESKKLIFDSLNKLSDIVTKAEGKETQGTPPREVPLFFPHGIGSISLKVNVTGVGELNFTISGETAPKSTPADVLCIESEVGKHS